MANADYYKTLEVSREATADEIKKAYRKLARKYHPDLHPGDKAAEKKFKEVQEAYDVLSDPDKRDQYDRFGSAAFEQGGPGPRSRTYTWSSQGGPNVEFDFGGDVGMEDILSSLFGGRPRPGTGAGGGRWAGPGARMPGSDIETQLSVPFTTALMGGEVDVTLPGKGERLSITIPPGVGDGARLRLAGKGQPSQLGGPPGDLYVLVRVEPHPYFTRKGSDVYLEVPISIAEAVLGGSIDVPTLDGTITLTIPQGTSSGQKLRLRGKGGKKKSGERGDQYVQVKVVVPKDVDDESKRLIEQFDRKNPTHPRRKLGW